MTHQFRLFSSLSSSITSFSPSISTETRTTLHKPMVSLPTLPVEMLHRIFDELDGATLFWSVRKVCRQLWAFVDAHHRYTLNLTSISKSDFHQLLCVIRPEYITGLSLSNGELTPDQIDLFVRLMDIDLFARLRSLTLLDIDETDVCPFSRLPADIHSLLLSSTRDYNIFWEGKQIIEHLSSIIGQSFLLHLELINEQLSRMIDQCQWTDKCKPRYLRIQGDKQNYVPVSNALLYK